MAIKIIEERTCDWCGESGEVLTHRLVFDKLAREVELHEACQDEATLPWLIEHGRRPTAAQVAAANNGAPKQAITCPFCPKVCNGYMGIAQHLGAGHKDVDKDERTKTLATIKKGLNK